MLNKSERELIFRLYEKASNTDGMDRNEKAYIEARAREDVLYMLMEELGIDGEYNKWYEGSALKC